MTRPRFRRCVLTVVALTAACGSPPEEVEAGGSPGTVTPRYVGEVFPIDRGDRVLLLVTRIDAVDVVEFDGETIAERASIPLEGYVLTVAGVLSTDGSTLDVVADTCPDGLSGVDPDWPEECAGESASVRVSMDTGSWQAGEARTVGPGLSFSPDEVSLLGGDLLAALGGIDARS